MNTQLGTIGKSRDTIYDAGDVYDNGDIYDDPQDVFLPKNPDDPIEIEPIKDPWDDTRDHEHDHWQDPIDNPKLPVYRQYNYKGVIVDSATGAPIPGASITLISNGQVIATTSAAYDGSFSIYTSLPGNSITFSSVGYKTWSFPASEYQTKFELEKDFKVLDPVLLPAGTKKNNIWLYAGLAALLLLATRKGK